MTTAQRASLEAVIETWVDANCEHIDVYWPDGFAEAMANQIATVIELMQNSNEKAE